MRDKGYIKRLIHLVCLIKHVHVIDTLYYRLLLVFLTVFFECPAYDKFSKSIFIVSFFSIHNKASLKPFHIVTIVRRNTNKHP